MRVAVGVGPKELARHRRADPVPARPGRPRTRRRRTRPQTRASPSSRAGPRRDDRARAANFTPEAWAVLEVIFAKYAAPGMCNPADPEPCTSGTPTQAQIDNDHRSLAQRQHDALIAVGRIALMSGELGQLNGLPVSIIIRTTLQDLESRAGVGVTGGGTMMPIADVIRLAAHANHYLAVFDEATGSALDAVPRQTGRLPGAADHADRPRRRLHQTVLHRRAPTAAKSTTPSRTGPTAATPTSTTRPGLRARQPRWSTTAAGTTTINARGECRMDTPTRTWTPAKPESTTTTAPNDSCDRPEDERSARTDTTKTASDTTLTTPTRRTSTPPTDTRRTRTTRPQSRLTHTAGE